MVDRLPGRKELVMYQPARSTDTDPWSHPDMKLKRDLYVPGDDSIQELTLEQARQILGDMGTDSDSRIRKVIKITGLFDPVDGGNNGFGATKWEYCPGNIFDPESTIGPINDLPDRSRYSGKLRVKKY